MNKKRKREISYSTQILPVPLSAEKCGIKIEGKNKWLTLIQNASKNY
jgi:hypothetical protein